jgi:hypothetical protein
MEKTVAKFWLNDPEAIARDLEYWRGRTAEERLSAVEILRRQMYGDTQSLQRVARVAQQSPG